MKDQQAIDTLVRTLEGFDHLPITIRVRGETAFLWTCKKTVDGYEKHRQLGMWQIGELAPRLTIVWTDRNQNTETGKINLPTI